jgi:hypothetical protein
MSDFKSSLPKRNLDFRPLTEGLGFHPFSDGLPYAPVSKASTVISQGTGAVAAGKPRFAMPRPVAPRVAVPIASPAPQPMVFAQQAEQQAQAAAAAAVVEQEDLRALLPGGVQEFGALYVAKRVSAFVVDSALNVLLCAATLSVALWKQDLSPDLLVNPSVILVASLFLGVFSWALMTAQEVAFGTTVGKRLFGLVLRGSTGALMVRALLFPVSVAVFGLGLLWSMADGRRRCWHDLVSRVQPVEIARL